MDGERKIKGIEGRTGDTVRSKARLDGALQLGNLSGPSNPGIL